MNSITQLPPEIIEILRDQEQFIQQMEAEGCPAATAACLRRALRIALEKTVARSKLRDFLLRQIRQNVQKLKLKRGCSDFPSDTPETLDEIENLVLQLPDVAEQRTLLTGVARFRKTYSALDVVPFREPEQEVSP